MLGLIRKIFGLGPKVNYYELVQNGAVVVDVRSKGEFAGGHMKNSINVPLNELQNKLSLFKDKNQAIITCCASGMRSGSAKSLLKSHGYLNVYNGGPWNSLQNKIK